MQNLDAELMRIIRLPIAVQEHKKGKGRAGHFEHRITDLKIPPKKYILFLS